MARKSTGKRGKGNGSARKTTRKRTTRAGARLARDPGGTTRAAGRVAAVLERHTPFRGREVVFENGRLVFKDPDLKAALAKALGAKPGTHSALIRLEAQKRGTKQGDQNVVLDARC
jgi:hypothetical protein